MAAHGLSKLYNTIGKRLIHARRFVLGLGRTNDAFGHGITELVFSGTLLVVRPGSNEDYLVIEDGPVDPSDLDMSYWSEVSLTSEFHWGPRGQLEHVDVFAADSEDVALVFEFSGGEAFSIVLCDGDVAIGRRLELFVSDPNHVRPEFQARIPGAPAE
ncbi:hypothetical protein [Sorangium sp. So ce362]|uniref:hypothetical protein n=1 Tax=Sorangium sp. So ce362 TaxID=3133303 RepID=UPI003F61E526